MTASALHQAERACEKAEQRAITARAALNKSAVKDGRLMGLLGSTDPRRVQYEAATRSAFDAERELQAAREALEKVRSANGSGVPAKGAVRAALSEAITCEARARRRIAENERAQERARTLVNEAQRQLVKAEGALERAKAGDMAAAMRAAHGGKPVTTLAAKMRKLQEAAADRVESMTAARAKLAEQVGELEAEHASAKRDLEAAVVAVVRDEVPLKRLVEETVRLQEQLVAKRLVLRALVWDGVIKEPARASVLAVLRAPLPLPIGDAVELNNWSQHASALALSELRAKLCVDASAAIDLS
jgi:hypothetical protein